MARIVYPDDLGPVGNDIVSMGQQFLQATQNEAATLKPTLAFLPDTIASQVQYLMQHALPDLEQVVGTWIFMGELIVTLSQKAQSAEAQLAREVRNF